MRLPVAMPVNRIPYRLAKPSQCGPYSRGRFMAVPKPAENRPAVRLTGPTVLLTAQFKRCLPVIGLIQSGGICEGIGGLVRPLGRSTGGHTSKTATTYPGLGFISGLGCRAEG